MQSGRIIHTIAQIADHMTPRTQGGNDTLFLRRVQSTKHIRRTHPGLQARTIESLDLAAQHHALDRQFQHLTNMLRDAFAIAGHDLYIHTSGKQCF